MNVAMERAEGTGGGSEVPSDGSDGELGRRRLHGSLLALEHWDRGQSSRGVPVEVTGMCLGCLGRSQCSNVFCICRSAGPAVIRVLMDSSVGTL